MIILLINIVLYLFFVTIIIFYKSHVFHIESLKRLLREPINCWLDENLYTGMQ